MGAWSEAKSARNVPRRYAVGLDSQGSGNGRPTPMQLSQGITPLDSMFNRPKPGIGLPTNGGGNGPVIHPIPDDTPQGWGSDLNRPDGISDEEWSAALSAWWRWSNRPDSFGQRRLDMDFDEWLARWMTRGNRGGGGGGGDGGNDSQQVGPQTLPLYSQYLARTRYGY